MSKRKMRMMGMMLAGVLAVVPFLQGCDSGSNATDSSNSQSNAIEEQENISDRGDEAETIHYAQVISINDNEITVDLGEMRNSSDGDESTFVSDEQQITFNKGDVVIVDESGAVLDAPELTTNQVIILSGTGEGVDFRPSRVEIINTDDNANNTGDTSTNTEAPSASQDSE